MCKHEDEWWSARCSTWPKWVWRGHTVQVKRQLWQCALRVLLGNVLGRKWYLTWGQRVKGQWKWSRFQGDVTTMQCVEAWEIVFLAWETRWITKTLKLGIRRIMTRAKIWIQFWTAFEVLGQICSRSGHAVVLLEERWYLEERMAHAGERIEFGYLQMLRW